MYDKTIKSLNARRTELQNEIVTIDNAISNLNKLVKTEPTQERIIKKVTSIKQTPAKSNGSKQNIIVDFLKTRKYSVSIDGLTSSLVGPRKPFKTAHAIKCHLTGLVQNGQISRVGRGKYKIV